MLCPYDLVNQHKILLGSSLKGIEIVATGLTNRLFDICCYVDAEPKIWHPLLTENSVKETQKLWSHAKQHKANPFAFKTRWDAHQGSVSKIYAKASKETPSSQQSTKAWLVRSLKNPHHAQMLSTSCFLIQNQPSLELLSMTTNSHRQMEFYFYVFPNEEAPWRNILNTGLIPKNLLGVDVCPTLLQPFDITQSCDTNWSQHRLSSASVDINENGQIAAVTIYLDFKIPTHHVKTHPHTPAYVQSTLKHPKAADWKTTALAIKFESNHHNTSKTWEALSTAPNIWADKT